MSSGDDFETRLQWLKDSIKDMMDYCNDNDVIGIPLLGSGLAADKNKKGNLTDLEYFQKFIQPEIEHLLPKAVAYYL
jgi:hypothetical protein